MACRILIADDSSPMRAIIKKTIKAAGYRSVEFLEAGNGEAALELLRQQPADLVFTDYNMPDMDGLDLLLKMKENPALAAIPVLLVTAFGNHHNLEKFQEAGAAGVIHKPFTPEAVKAELNRILGEQENGACTENGNEGLDF